VFSLHAPIRAAVLAAAATCLVPAAAGAASVSLQPAAGPAGSATMLRGAGLARGRAVMITAPGISMRVVTDRSGAFRAPIRVARGARGWWAVATRLGRVRVVNRFRVGEAGRAGEVAAPGGARLRWTSVGRGAVRLRAAGLPRRRAVTVSLGARRLASGRSTTAGRFAATLPASARGNAVLRAGRVRLPFTLAAADGARPVDGQTASGSAAGKLPSLPAVPGAQAPAPGAGGAQPGDLAFPIRAAFYYPWFPQGWNQQGMNPFTHYHPSLGYYDSGDPAVIARHLDDFSYGHIQVGISSWWGQGHWTDNNFAKVLSVTHSTGSPVRWAVYYEQEGFGDPSVAQLTSDLVYLRDHYASDPSYLKMGGRFVVFAYGDANDGCAMADRWRAANAGVGAFLVLKVFPGYQTCPAQPDGWHQYAPANREQSQAGSSFTVSPGFWLATDSAPRLARDPACFRRAVRDMVASGAPWQLVTTFDEWGEGTSVEPAQEWASASGHGAYLDALHDDGAGAAASSPC
jgi:hypothetical protein